MTKYIDAGKLIAEIERWRDKAKEKYNESIYSMGRCDALAEFRNYIVSLQKEQPKDTDALRAKLVNFLTRNDIQEDKAKYLADRISDTYGAQRYLDGLCDAANAYEQQEQPKVDLKKEIDLCWQDWISPSNQSSVEGVLPKSEFSMYARHFYELGLNARKEK